MHTSCSQVRQGRPVATTGDDEASGDVEGLQETPAFHISRVHIAQQ